MGAAAAGQLCSFVCINASRRQAGRSYQGQQKNRTSARTECGIVSKPLDKTIFNPYNTGAKTIFYCEGSEPRTQFSSKEGDGREPFAFVLESRFCFYVPNYSTISVCSQEDCFSAEDRRRAGSPVWRLLLCPSMTDRASLKRSKNVEKREYKTPRNGSGRPGGAWRLLRGATRTSGLRWCVFSVISRFRPIPCAASAGTAPGAYLPGLYRQPCAASAAQ